MQDLYFVITILRRQYEENFIRFFRENGVARVLGMPCEGTAAHELLDILGLEAVQRTALFAVVTHETRRKIMRGLVRQMGLDMPNAGIAINVPLSAVGGRTVFDELVAGQSVKEEEENSMHDMPYSLIAVIANAGCTDMVMEAARSANATGGTVLHVKGTGSAENAQKFFGLSIVDEKELILIAATAGQSSAIMKAVMTKCGNTTKAHAKCMALPVDQIAGFDPDNEE